MPSARIGVNEHGSRLRQARLSRERIVREQQPTLDADFKRPQTLSARTGTTGDLFVNRMSVLRRAPRRPNFGSNRRCDRMNEE